LSSAINTKTFKLKLNLKVNTSIALTLWRTQGTRADQVDQVVRAPAQQAWGSELNPSAIKKKKQKKTQGTKELPFQHSKTVKVLYLIQQKSCLHWRTNKVPTSIYIVSLFLNNVIENITSIYVKTTLICHL
jgi:hypothetical protein